MKLFNLKSKKAAAGFTLVEILLVVGFIALAGIGIYTIYNKVQVSSSANAEGRNLDALRAGVKNLYGGSSSYAGLINRTLNDARITPDSMRAVPYVAGATAINNSFGGAVIVTPVTLGGGAANNGFQITYPNVPGDVCAKLVTVAGKGFDQVSIGGTTVKAFGTNNLQVDAVATNCAADTGAGVSLVFSSL